MLESRKFAVTAHACDMAVTFLKGGYVIDPA